MFENFFLFEQLYLLFIWIYLHKKHSSFHLAIKSNHQLLYVFFDRNQLLGT
jgi:hypothetical protein